MASEESVRDALSSSLPAVKERSVLSSPRMKTPPTVPSRLGGGPRCQTIASARTSNRTSHDSQLEQLSSQNAHLRDELQSLRDMYAKHTAYTELKCERLSREKDQECTAWYKTQKEDIAKMKSCVNVMHALFTLKYRRLAGANEEEKHHHEEMDESLHGQVERLKKERLKVVENHQELLASKTSEHTSEMDAMRLALGQVEAKANRSTEQLSDAKREIDHLKDLNRKSSQEATDARDRLIEVEKRAAETQKDGQIEELEAELKATRKSLKEGWKKDVMSLRQELMDYVRFIVHILPENWCETEAAEKVPPDLKEQLVWMAGNKNGSGSPGKAKRQGFLPPTDLLAKGAFGVQHALHGSTSSPRKRGAMTTTF